MTQFHIINATCTLQLLDGLRRKETSFRPVRIQRSEQEASKEDQINQNDAVAFTGLDTEGNKKLTAVTKERKIGAYVVTNRLKLPPWDTASAVVLLPSGSDYWRDKNIRTLADRISHDSQCTVVVPDIYQSQSYRATEPKHNGTEVDPDDAENALKMFRGKIFKSQEKWWKHQNPKRIFDDIVASMSFLQSEYHIKNIVLMGVGEGGGLALEAACTLGDVARLSMYTEIEDALLEQKLIPPLAEGSDEVPFDAVDAAIQTALAAGSGPVFEVLNNVLKENLLTFSPVPLAKILEERLREENEEQTRIHEEAAAKAALAAPVSAPTPEDPPRADSSPHRRAPKLYADLEDEDEDDEEDINSKESAKRSQGEDEDPAEGASTPESATPGVTNGATVIENPLGEMQLDADSVSKTLDESPYFQKLMQMDPAELLKGMENEVNEVNEEEGNGHGNDLGEGKYSDFVPKNIAESPVFQSIDDIVTNSNAETEESVPLSSFLRPRPTDQEVEEALRGVDVAAWVENRLSKSRTSATSTGVGVDAGAVAQKPAHVAGVPAPATTNISAPSTPFTGETETAIGYPTTAPTTSMNSSQEWRPDPRYVKWKREPTEAEIQEMKDLDAADEARIMRELNLDYMRRQWPQVLHAARRAERRQILDPFATISMADLPKYVPRLVLAVSPERLVRDSL